jgi:hypothetical protein
LAPIKNKSGRMYVTLCNNGKKKNEYVARLVADHFLPNKPFENVDVRHISNDKTDNRVDNLKWGKVRQRHTISKKGLVNDNKIDEASEELSVNEDDQSEDEL